MARKAETDIWRERKRLCGKADEVSTTTIQALTARLTKLFQDYELQNILNLDEVGLFFKALPEKALT